MASKKSKAAPVAVDLDAEIAAAQASLAAAREAAVAAGEGPGAAAAREARDAARLAVLRLTAARDAALAAARAGVARDPGRDVVVSI